MRVGVSKPVYLYSLFGFLLATASFTYKTAYEKENRYQDRIQGIAKACDI